MADKRIVVITGGTSGIGKAMAEQFRAQGDIVLILARSCDAAVEGNYACDVSDEIRVREVFRAIGAKYGRIDILINNAGFGISGAMELLPTEEARRNMDVNFFGILYCSQAALPYMGIGARILNISSACAIFPLPFRGMYCASKAAVSMLSRTMGMETKDSGVYVADICPGDIKTNFTANRVKEIETNSRYGDRVKKAQYKIDSREDKRMSAEKVAVRLVRIAGKRRLKPRYIIGGKYKVFNFIQKVVPDRAFIWFMGRYFGGK